MITIRFGLKADMRGKTFVSPTLDTTLGSITGIQSNNSAKVTAGTTKGGSVAMDGKFKFSSENSLRDSDVTGITFFDKSHHLLLSVSGVTDVTFEDVGRREKPQLMLNFLLQDVGLGVTVQGSAFNDVLVGYSGNDRLFGNAGNDTLRGGAGNDTLNGGIGADRLDGGVGKDVMVGGKGDDIYIIDRAADTVAESAGAGTDKVQSSSTWTMGANVESLTLTGSSGIDATGNASDNNIFGNAAANILRGAAGNDRLDGKGGADRLDGGLGNDLFIVDKTSDVVVERLTQGTDPIQSSVSYTLPNHVENLTLLGSANLNATGNSLDNVLRGNAGANTLNPGLGDDVLVGNGGADSFVVVGGVGDTLRIDDLLSGTDHLLLSHDAVSQVGLGALAGEQLRASGDAANGTAHLGYAQASGVLAYDANANGASLVTLVSLGAGTVLLADDITVIA